MTGYQEILTDPSFRQIVTLTNPHISNTGAIPMISNRRRFTRPGS